MARIIAYRTQVNSMTIKPLLSELHDKFKSHYQQQHGTLPCMYHDADWPSPCEVGEVLSEQQIQWQAVPQPSKNSLSDLANALECRFPEALNEFYSSFYAGNIIGNVEGHQIELLQAWNEDDFVRLQQNITGHVLMKRKLKHADTVFIGLTEQDDLLITVELETGKVWLEYVGKRPHHVLADSLEAFLQAVEF